MTSIYVLELTGGKFYIGKAKKVRQRFNRHKRRGGSFWTAKHKPLKIVETFKIETEYDEEVTTYKYMKKYGIDNVRGGSFCKEKFTDIEKMILRRIIYSCSDQCYCCGSIKHFSNVCPEKKLMIYGVNKEKINRDKNFLKIIILLLILVIILMILF